MHGILEISSVLKTLKLFVERGYIFANSPKKKKSFLHCEF
jgi:hypothetical protein